MERADVPGGLVRRVDGSGAARARLHHAQRRPGHLGTDHPAVRAAGGVEPRSPVGSRRVRDPRSIPRSLRARRRSPSRTRSRAAWRTATARLRTRSRCGGSARSGRSSTCSATTWTARWPRCPSRARPPGRCRPARCCSTPADADALAAAGLASGVVFETVLADDEPAETTQLDEAPRVAMLAGGSGRNDTLWSLEQIFGADVQIVTMSSILNSATDPCSSPSTSSTTRDRHIRPSRRAMSHVID